MKSRSRSHTPMDVDPDPFSFDQMRDQLDGIQQANSNYEQNKSSCSRSHSSTQSFEKKWRISWFKAKIKVCWDSEFVSDAF